MIFVLGGMISGDPARRPVEIIKKNEKKKSFMVMDIGFHYPVHLGGLNVQGKWIFF